MYIIAIAVVLSLGLVFLKLLHSKNIRPRYRGVTFEGCVHARRLLNKTELALYRRMLEAFPEYLVFSQVALSQVVGLRRGAPRTITNSYYRLVADFVVCDQEGVPIAVVECDGPWHESASQAERDDRKDHVLAAAGVQVVRIKSASLPEPKDLRARISKVVSRE